MSAKSGPPCQKADVSADRGRDRQRRLRGGRALVPLAITRSAAAGAQLGQQRLAFAPPEREQQEGVVVERLGHEVADGSRVLAGGGPVRTRAGGDQVRAAFGEQRHPGSLRRRPQSRAAALRPTGGRRTRPARPASRRWRPIVRRSTAGMEIWTPYGVRRVPCTWATTRPAPMPRSITCPWRAYVRPRVSRPLGQDRLHRREEPPGPPALADGPASAAQFEPFVDRDPLGRREPGPVPSGPPLARLVLLPHLPVPVVVEVRLLVPIEELVAALDAVFFRFGVVLGVVLGRSRASSRR